MSEMSIEAEASQATPSKIKTVLCATLLVIWIVIGALVMMIAHLLRWKWLRFKFPRLFHGFVSVLCGMKATVSGEPRAEGAVLFVSNHISYLDIFVLGNLLEGSFVAKSEVAGWPVFGKLAALQNTLFLERRASKAREQIGVVRNHLDHLGNLIMFPEGTSTAGDYVAKFRSSLFAATEGVTIQPITIAYTHYRGERMNAATRDHYAWYLPDPSVPNVNNKPFLKHFLDALGLGPSRVEVIFHKPTRIGEDLSRKDCALLCEAAVRNGLQRALGLSAEHAELAADA